MGPATLAYHIMTDTLQQFVFDTLDVWEAGRTEISPGVWKVDLPGGEEGHAAWFLGRSTGSLMITFDLDRWEEGTRLECLTLASPLVRRLQQYAEARGCFATVTVTPPGSKMGRYEPSPDGALFNGASCRSDRVVEQHSWIGFNRVTGALVRVTGDPLHAPGLHEGEPPESDRVPPTIGEREALESLVVAWEDIMRSTARVNSNARHAQGTKKKPAKLAPSLPATSCKAVTRSWRIATPSPPKPTLRQAYGSGDRRGRFWNDYWVSPRTLGKWNRHRTPFDVQRVPWMTCLGYAKG